MVKNERSSSSGAASSAPFRPSITLPPRTAMESLFTGVAGASPGPMTLVSNFFAENDPDSDCRSFSQLLAGAMASPVARPILPEPDESSSKEKEAGGGGDFSFRFQPNRPSGLMIAQPPMFTVPPGLSPASLLDSPGWFSPGQGPHGMSHQQVLAQVTAQAAPAHSPMHNPAEFSSALSAAPSPALPRLPSFTDNVTRHQQASLSDPSLIKESCSLSHFDQRSQPSTLIIDKPADDGYNWRKYGQKQVKGSEYPRSYYKCTHPNCPVKKKVERSLDGQITEIIYKGQHNHQPPQPSKRGKDTGNVNGSFNHQENSELAIDGQPGNLNAMKEGIPAYSLCMKDLESRQPTPENLSGSSDSEDIGDAETRDDGRAEDEPEAKRRNTEIRVMESTSSHRTVAEPRIIVQTTSEVDLLDDGYRWRKYGQKVVKGNPYPRSYYKCTSPGCNVRKHVERAASDPRAVITAYEGKHNHDVPAARNSSHNTASNNVSQLKAQNAMSDKHSLVRNNDPQKIPLLQFKEELT